MRCCYVAVHYWNIFEVPAGHQPVLRFLGDEQQVRISTRRRSGVRWLDATENERALVCLGTR